MKQAERSRRSRSMIRMHAFTEFAEHGYAGSGINQICTRGNISKGLLYHYYENKDALYLDCISLLFQEMTNFLRGQLDLSTLTIDQYFAMRIDFFQKHPMHRQLFYDVLIYPQSHLAEQIAKCRQEFDQFNDHALRTILQKENLADRLTLDQAIAQFRAFVHFLGVYIREDSVPDADQKAHELLHTMLYGLIMR